MPMTLTPAQFFQALSDSTRIRSLLLLAQEEALCCELTYALNMAQPKVSCHLALLRETGIVTDRRQGQWIYYRFNTALPCWAQVVMDANIEAVKDQQPCRDDCSQLMAMPNRPGNACCA